MKKALKFLPLFLLAAVLGVLLALNAGAATTAKYKVYISADQALSTSGGTVGGVTYDLVGGQTGYQAVFASLKTVVAGNTANDDGTVVINGENTEIWVYVSGKVASKLVNGVDTRIGGSDFFGSAGIWIKGSNGKWATIHVTSVNPSSPATLAWNSSSSGTVWALNNDLYLENIIFSAQTQNDSGASHGNVGEANRFYVGAGFQLNVVKKDGTAGGKPIMRMGSRDNNALKTGMTATILSGSWGTLDILGGYRGTVEGDVTFTFGGTATCTTLGLWANGTVNKYNSSTDQHSLFADTNGVGGDRLNDLRANVTVNITGGTMTYYLGGFGDSSVFNPVVLTGSVTTNVSGSATISTYEGGGNRGTIHGTVTNNFSAASGKIPTVKSAYYGAIYGGVVEGSVYNNINALTCNGSFRAGGHSAGAAYPVITNGIRTIFNGTNETIFVNNYCSGSGMQTTVRADNGGVSYTYKGTTYTGAIVNVVYGGSLAGTYNTKRDGTAPSGTENYGFTGAEAHVFGNVVNIAENAFFGDFYGASRNASGWTSSDPDNTGFHGSVTNILTDCVMREYSGGVSKSPTYGSITNTLTRCRMEHFYGGGGNYNYGDNNARVFGDITNTLTDCSIQFMGREGALSFYYGTTEGAFYGGGRGDQIGTASSPVTVRNTIRTVDNETSRIINYYGGSVNASVNGTTFTSTIYGDIINDIENIDTYTNNFAAGGFYGNVAGNITTTIDGAKTRIGSFYGSGLRCASGSVTGAVSVTVKAGTFNPATTFSLGSTAFTYTTGGVDYACVVDSAASYSLVLDLTDRDITNFAFNRSNGGLANKSVEIKAGSGTLTLVGTPSAYAMKLPVTTLTGTPDITLSGAAVGGCAYLTLPAGSAESDVNFTRPAGSDVLYVDTTFIGALSPVGSTIILEDEGNFALRYLFVPDEVTGWTTNVGAAPAFTYSLDGVNYSAIALDANNIEIDGTQYKFFIISGIRAKNLGTAVRVCSASFAADDEYSVSEACETVVAQSTNAAFVAFANALLDYGKAANAYHNNDATPVTYTVDVMDEGYTDLYTDESYKSGTGSLVNIRATSLVTKEALFLKFYMKVNPTVDVTTLKVWVNGAETDIALEQNNGYYSAAYQVPANRMEELAVVEIKDANGVLVSNTYADSVTSYCAKVISRAGESAEYAAFTPLARYVEEFVAASTAYLSAN